MKSTLTVGELGQRLESIPADWQIIFGCEALEFYRIKQRGDALVQIEFSQTLYSTPDGKVHIENH